METLITVEVSANSFENFARFRNRGGKKNFFPQISPVGKTAAIDAGRADKRYQGPPSVPVPSHPRCRRDPSPRGREHLILITALELVILTALQRLRQLHPVKCSIRSWCERRYQCGGIRRWFWCIGRSKRKQLHNRGEVNSRLRPSTERLIFPGNKVFNRTDFNCLPCLKAYINWTREK